jgi:hypothetical protein
MCFTPTENDKNQTEGIIHIKCSLLNEKSADKIGNATNEKAAIKVGHRGAGSPLIADWRISLANFKP